MKMKNITTSLALLWTILTCCVQVFASSLPPTGSGSEYASRCNAAKQDWVQSQGRTFLSETTITSTITSLMPGTSITTKTYLSSDDAPYTLCDGFPRINGSRTISTVTTTSPWTSIQKSPSSVFRSIRQPDCTIAPNDCAGLQKSYSSDLAIYESSSDANTPPPSPTSPICGSATVTPIQSSLGQPLCAMQEASVKLLYWPVTVDSSCDSCHRASCPTSTMGPTITGKPNTVKTLNTTLTSPTVYIEFEGSWAYTSEGTTFSSPQTLIIAQEPEAVSSHCGKPGGGYGPPQKVNYANFNYPVPADIYRCQPSCFVEPMPYTYANITQTFTYSLDKTTETNVFTHRSYISEAASNLCSTIWNDYAPVLMIPEAFKTIQPAGFQEPGSMYGDDNPCYFIFNEDAVLFDPPLALTEVSDEAKPTMPNANSAYPTSGQLDPTAAPVQTSEPKVTALPESLGLTMPNNGPVATVYTDPKPANDSPRSTPAIGDVIASVVGMTSKGQGQDQHRGKLTLAMASDGSAIVVNGVTTAVPGQAPHATAAANDDGTQTGMITVDGGTMGYTNADGTLVIGDQTLSRGGSVVVTAKASSTRTTQHQSTASASESAARASTTSSALKAVDTPHIYLLLAFFLTAAIWTAW